MTHFTIDNNCIVTQKFDGLLSKLATYCGILQIVRCEEVSYLNQTS